MQNTDIAIVILSCDKFKVTWKPCFDHLFNVWPDCSYPVYLLNNFIPSKDERVKNLLVGEDLNWSDTLKKGLLKIKEKRIFFIFDDSFITEFNLEEVKLIFMIAIENDLDSVVLRKRVFDSGKRFNENIYKINPTAKYRNSLFLNLIKKDLLLGLLKSGENAWQFEKDGNKRNEKFDFYSVYNSKLVTYEHGIVKGKWLPKTYIYLKNKGYLLNGNTFKNHSKFKMFSMKIYTIIFYTVHKFTHLFKST
tara:strand:+ start:8484 stop:9230 length:747 start_codon:yes stop_codon:yes gene_type:complete